MRTQLQRFRFATFILILFSLIGLSFAGAQGLPTLVIGVLDDERGALADGARLAVREINDAGGIQLGEDMTFLLELQIQPPEAAGTLEDAVEALSETDAVAVIGPPSSEQVLNDLPALQSLGVPVLTPATGDTLLTTDASGMLMRARASEAVQGQALASFLINQLDLDSIATAQLDIASTASLLGFATAASTLGVSPQPTLLLRSPDAVEDMGGELLDADPDAVVAYGNPALAGALYNALREGGWIGLFVYNQASDLSFTAVVPPNQLNGVVSAMTWAYTSVDSASATFLNAFIRTYGRIPGALEAAGYDSIRLIAEALEQPADLRTNLRGLRDVRGVQGILNPAGLSSGEMSNNVAIIRLNEFGAPDVLARYAGAQLLSPDFPAPAPEESPTPQPTPTPEGVVFTVTSERQNVRSGPGLDQAILGQLIRGEQVEVVGRSIDSAWIVIDFLDQQGWLAANLGEVFGNLNSVPVVAPPAPPTPDVTTTPTAAPEPDLIIQSAAISPLPIVPGQPFNVTVTVQNIGGGAAGQFAISGTFPPNNALLTTVVPGVAPGQTTVVNMSGILTTTGTFTAALIIDANNQVFEGQVGELNNIYNLTYTIDRAVLRQASQVLNLGDTLDLEGNGMQGDANWNADGGLALDAIFGARLGVLLGGDINAINWDQINPGSINRESIPRAELNPGTLIGITTADGNRGIIRVDTVSDTQLGVTFRVYQG